MSKKAQSKFPDVLYVTIEDEDTDYEYLSTAQSLAEIAIVGKVRKVAVYRKEIIENVTATVQVVE